jgi:hypothetical protein
MLLACCALFRETVFDLAMRGAFSRALPCDVQEANRLTIAAFSEGTPGSVVYLSSEGLDGVRRLTLLIKVEAPLFEGTVGPVDIGIGIDNTFRVAHVKAGSAAHMSGEVAQYDEILEIDDSPILPSATRREIENKLKREAGQRIVLLLAPSTHAQPPGATSHARQTKRVELVASDILDSTRATAVQTYRHILLRCKSHDALHRMQTGAPLSKPPPIFWGVSPAFAGAGTSALTNGEALAFYEDVDENGGGRENENGGGGSRQKRGAGAIEKQDAGDKGGGRQAVLFGAAGGRDAAQGGDARNGTEKGWAGVGGGLQGRAETVGARVSAITPVEAEKQVGRDVAAGAVGGQRGPGGKAIVEIAVVQTPPRSTREWEALIEEELEEGQSTVTTPVTIPVASWSSTNTSPAQEIQRKEAMHHINASHHRSKSRGSSWIETLFPPPPFLAHVPKESAISHARAPRSRMVDARIAVKRKPEAPAARATSPAQLSLSHPSPQPRTAALIAQEPVTTLSPPYATATDDTDGGPLLPSSLLWPDTLRPLQQAPLVPILCLSPSPLPSASPSSSCQDAALPSSPAQASSHAAFEEQYWLEQQQLLQQQLLQGDERAQRPEASPSSLPPPATATAIIPPGGSGGGGGGDREGVLGQDSDSGFSSDSFSGGRAGRGLRRVLAAPGSVDAAMSDQHGTGGDKGASSDRPSPPGILISPREGLVSRYTRSRSRSSESREHREVTFQEPPHNWQEADQDAAATLRQKLTPPPPRSPHLPPNSIAREKELFESAERERELLAAAGIAATAAAAADEKRRTLAAVAAVAADENRMLTSSSPVLPAKLPSSDSQEGKQWRQPEAVRKMFLDRQRAIERYYLNFAVDDAVALTRETVKTGAVQPLLDFQRAELMALVDAYDRLILENIFDAFDLDSDGVLSEEEGTALLSLWLKGAHLHLLPVLHSLVAGLVSSKMRMVLAFGRNADQGNNANMWGQDSDVAWVLRSSAPSAFAV